METPASSSRAVPFDVARLEGFLRERLGLSDAMTIETVAGGQSNPTYFIGFGRQDYVLRKKPPGRLLPSAHAVDREFRVQAALAEWGIPVPKMVLFHPDDDVVGTPFYVMERVEGRIFSDSALRAAPAGERRAMYRSLAHTLAAIHDVDIDRAGLRDFGKTGDYLRRQIERWSRQWEMSRTLDIPEIDRLAAWLRASPPTDDETTIVHGDFRIGNVIFHPTKPEIVAVLDWELSTLGDPLADLAHTCIYGWYIGPDEYGGIRGLDLAEAGLPTMDEFIADYRERRPTERPFGRLHIALALFRNAVIFAGIASRARDGNAASDDAEKVGALAPVFARRGLAVAEQQE